MYHLTQETHDDWHEVEYLFDLAFAPGRSALSSYRLRDGVDPVAELCIVARDDDVIEKHVVEPREHTRILMPMISECLLEAGLDVGDLDYVVLGNGPGSFIGMRIGASVAQGIAHASGAGMIPVSSLAAIAAEARDRFERRRAPRFTPARSAAAATTCGTWLEWYVLCRLAR